MKKLKLSRPQTNTDPDSQILVLMPNEGLQGTNDIAQVAKSLVPRSIKTRLCTPIKFGQA